MWARELGAEARSEDIFCLYLLSAGTKLPFSELLLTADLGAHNPFELITLLALFSFHPHFVCPRALARHTLLIPTSNHEDRSV